MNNIKDVEEGFIKVREQGLFLKGHARLDLFIQQIDYEWNKVIDLLQNHPIQYGMEIGTYGGGTFYTLCQSAEDNAVLISLDLHQGQYDNIGYKEIGLRSLGKPNQEIYVLNRDSHEEESFLWTNGILRGNKLDYLFIDGDHSYDGVKQDFEMYSPLVKEGGIILFHDIQPHNKGAQVDILWNEIKNNYRHEEYIEDIANQKWAGIGVIYK